MSFEADLQDFLKIIEELTKRDRFNFIDNIFPDKGPHRRELYPKHMEFLEATKNYREAAMIAANRVGKTLTAAYAVTCWLTGNYPDWWKGRRFDGPVDVWAVGQSGETTRDVLQFILLGRTVEIGTGMIPKELIHKTTPRLGVPDAIKDVVVKHKNGGYSYLGFKSYDQGIVSFMGTAKQVIWLDEEPPQDVYSECLMRTMTVKGLVISTFTPLIGMSDVVLSFLEQAEDAEFKKFFIQISWDDVPHLSKKDKDELWAALPAHQRASRSKGTPDLGSGAVYPIPEDDIKVDPFEIPEYWPRAYGFDVGWNNTAAIWGAYDRETATWYLYSEYLRGQAEPVIHAAAIKLRGYWIPGQCDPHADNAAQKDGESILYLYLEEGLLLEKANNSREAGIYKVYQGLSVGKIKVFSTLTNWLREYRKYRRDKHNQIVKKEDHLMDATRYLIMGGPECAILRPFDDDPETYSPKTQSGGMSAVGGY